MDLCYGRPIPSIEKSSMKASYQRPKTDQEQGPKDRDSAWRSPSGSRAIGRNETGIPDRLKSNVERLSGLDLSAVRVRYNSDQPARIDALAYARGAEVHLGRGHHDLLSHELWHVVQQSCGRVGATRQVNGVPINDDPTMEREADHFGRRAGTAVGDSVVRGDFRRTLQTPRFSNRVAQRVAGWSIDDTVGTIRENSVLEQIYSQRQENQRPAAGHPNHAAYVANVPAVANANLNLAAIANRYRQEGFANVNDADQRLAMVFGVNRYRDAESNTEATMGATRNNFAQHLGNYNHFPVAVISFWWDPRWRYNNQTRTIDQVRQEYQDGDEQTQAAIRQTQQSKFQAGGAQRVIPYGEIRDRIRTCQSTNDFVGNLQRDWSPVYVHTGDADVTSLRVKGSTPAAPGAPSAHQLHDAYNQGLFQAMDQVVAQAGQNPPGILTGSYDFRLPANRVAQNTTVDEYMTMIASRLDLAVREAMAAADSRAIYYPEPNTFFQAGAYATGTFGSGPQEGQQMVDSLLANQQANPARMGQGRGMAIGTSADRFSVGAAGGNLNAAQLNFQTLNTLFDLTQSAARMQTWSGRVSDVLNSVHGQQVAGATLQGLYSHAFPHRIANSIPGIVALTNPQIDQSVNTFVNGNADFADNVKPFVRRIARNSGKMALAFIKSLINHWPGNGVA